MPGEEACRRGLLSRERARSWFAGLALVLICLAVYVPGLATTPTIDRDEARFAQASRQMLESGDWLIPRVQDRLRLNKPPLIYWLQASSAAALTGNQPQHDAIWMYRVPSVLCAISAVLLTWRLGRSMFDPRVGWLAAALLAVCPLVVFDAHQARADQLLLATSTLTMLAAWSVLKRAWEGQPVPILLSIGLWAAVGQGVLAKGPITPLILALTVAWMAFVGRRAAWIRSLRPFLGLAVIALMVGPWFGVVVHRVGFSNYIHIIFEESLGRAAGSKEGHFGPPGMHAVLLAVLFWPGSMLTLAGFTAAWNKAFTRRHEVSPGHSWPRRLWGQFLALAPGRTREFFLIAWLLPAWVFFELFGAKLPHYTMPLYPAIAILTARHVLALGRRWPIGSVTVGGWIWALIGTVPLLAVGVAGIVLPQPASWYSGWPLGVLLAGLGFGLLVASISWLRRGVVVRTHVIAIAAAVCLAIAAFASLRAVLPGRQTAAIISALNQAAPDWRTLPIASEHREDSIVFETRGRVVRLDPGLGAGWLAGRPAGTDAIAILENSAQPEIGEVIAIIAPGPFDHHGWAVVRTKAGRPPAQ